MNRQNYEQDALNNISNIRREVLQLCNASGSDVVDFHKLGFSCLLKKLHEIERIITGLKDMPIDAHSTPLANRYQPIFTDSESSANHCCEDVRENPTILSLPDELTPHTKRVLLDIYNKIERSLDDFYENTRLKLKQSFEDNYRKLELFMSSFREKQKAEVRLFIENILLDDDSNVMPPDTFSDDISHVNTPQPHQTSHQAQLPFSDVPLVNMDAVKRTLQCPTIDPQLKRAFFANLNGLNDILTEIMEQVGRGCPQISREIPTTKPPSNSDMPPLCEDDETPSFSRSR